MGCGVFACELDALLTKSFNNFTQFLKIFLETKQGKQSPCGGRFCWHQTRRGKSAPGSIILGQLLLMKGSVLWYFTFHVFPE